MNTYTSLLHYKLVSVYYYYNKMNQPGLKLSNYFITVHPAVKFLTLIYAQRPRNDIEPLSTTFRNGLTQNIQQEEY